MEDTQSNSSRKTARVFQPTVLFHSQGRNPGDVHEQQQAKPPQSILWPYMMSLQNYINFPLLQLQVNASSPNLSSCFTSSKGSSSICPLGCSSLSCPDQAHPSSSVSEEAFKSVPPTQPVPTLQTSNFLPLLQSNKSPRTIENTTVGDDAFASVFRDLKTTDAATSRVQSVDEAITTRVEDEMCLLPSQDQNKHWHETIQKIKKPLEPLAGRKKLKCPFCNVSCSNHGQLRGHLRCHTGEKPFVCAFDGCTRKFARNEELTRHKRIHTGDRPFACSACKKTFGRRDHLQKHLKTHLQPGEKKTFVCDVCHQGYSRSDALTRHKGTAHSESRVDGQEKYKITSQET